MDEPRYWLNPIDKCDWCSTPFGKTPGAKMYDARSRQGPWGNFCSECFPTVAGRLGLGHGQEYTCQADGRWLKTGG